MDNVKFHLQASIANKIEEKGAKVVFLPPYSPDFLRLKICGLK